MLVNLQIKDFLLIDELELDFYPGLTVITGETGSGKSITIDALMLIFGAKASADIIRAKQTHASFSATFEVDNNNILAWLKAKEFVDSHEENTIICRRVIDRNGRSKAYINSLPVTLGVLKELGEMLLDIHTQHASIALLKTDNQRFLLDEFAKIGNLISEVGVCYREVNQLTAKLNQAREFSQDLVEKQEVLRGKIADVASLNLNPNEWEELQVQQKQLANAGFILQELDYAVSSLNSEGGSLSQQIATLAVKLAKISEYLPNANQICQLTTSLEAELDELNHELEFAASKIEHNPELLAEIDARIDEIYSLARRYRIAPEEILLRRASWEAELANLVADTDLELLAAELTTAQQQYLTLARQVSYKRQAAAQHLSQQVTALLHQLAISGEFRVVVEPTEQFSATGIDSISYQVCFNPGMPLQPLSKVASGGELSRVALALYVTLSINNPPEVIVFDEIDVGIGGAVAEVVGRLLHELGQSKQAICITHQPQTACAGNHHLKVQKNSQAGVSQSQTLYIEDTERVNEIARMLGGINITEITLSHAREMLQMK